MKSYWQGRYYYLALMCLVIAIVLLQPKSIECCANFKADNLQTWLESITSPTISTVPDNSIDSSATTQTDVQEPGYVFSFPTITTTPDGLQSNLPQTQLQDDGVVVQEDVTLDPTITSTSTTINLISSAKNALLEPSQQQSIFTLSTILILLASSIMQGASGFAFSLLMMPLLVWNGFSLVEANIFTATNGFVLCCFMVYKLRKEVMWHVLWPTYVPRIGGMVIGILLLSYLNGLDKVLIRQLLGVVLLLTVMIQLVVRIKPRDELHRGWWWTGFGSSGLLGGMVGFGGPPVVLWVMAHNWSNIESRALMAALYWSIVPVQIFLLIFTFGKPIAQFSLQALYFVPVVVAGVFVGILLGNLLNKPKLQKFVQALLLLTAVTMLVAPYVGLT